jgi:hypothetical protein
MVFLSSSKVAGCPPPSLSKIRDSEALHRHRSSPIRSPRKLRRRLLQPSHHPHYMRKADSLSLGKVSQHRRGKTHLSRHLDPRHSIRHALRIQGSMQLLRVKSKNFVRWNIRQSRTHLIHQPMPGHKALRRSIQPAQHLQHAIALHRPPDAYPRHRRRADSMRCSSVGLTTDLSRRLRP